jgi:hypothetical protein
LSKYRSISVVINKCFSFRWWMALLFLPFGAIASAENETHPVNGEWTLQSESFGGSEQHYILTFYPDGTFRLFITETSSLVSEEYEDEEDSEDWPNWDEFIAEVDINDNGFLDEEDFEAAREPGDEDSWEQWLGEIGDADGNEVIDQEEYEQVYESYENEEEDWVEWMTDIFGETMVTTTTIKGIWEASEDEVILTRDEAIYEFNDFSLTEYYTLLLDFDYKMMVRQAEKYNQEAIGEEEFYLMILSNLGWDSEGNRIDVPESASLEELKALAVDQAVVMFLMLVDKPAEFGMELKTFVFNLDIDQMSLMHSERERLVFTRSEASSVIKAFSWGEIKALPR